MPKVSLYQRTGRAIGRLSAILVPLGGDFGELLLRLPSLIYTELYPLKLRNGLPHVRRFRSIYGGRQVSRLNFLRLLLLVCDGQLRLNYFPLPFGASGQSETRGARCLFISL